MAIDTSLLVASPTLQDALIDVSTGLPLVNGTVTLYQDNNRTTLKNWYYQSGTPGAYTYITLPNPMTLSGVGTITDGNGNDTIPFFYPFSEIDNTTAQPYYVVVTNSNGQQQFTRQNFPFNPPASSEVINDTLLNYVINTPFWRNAGTVNATTPANTTTINGSTFYYSTIAPSAHDGFSMQDMIYAKNATGSTDTITFTKLPAGNFLDPDGDNLDVSPEYYVNITCSGTGGGETQKYIQIPLSLHLKTLEAVPSTITFYARCNSSSGTGGNNIAVNILQFSGTGSSASVVTTLQTSTLPISTNFNKISVKFTMPSVGTITPSATGDDAIYIQLAFTSGVQFNIDIAKPCYYVGNDVPSNECDLYDQVDSVINSPRTGDYRTSLNSFSPFGWVQCNDGVISNAGTFSGATVARANQDTWPLFNLIWTLGQPHDTGSNSNPIAQIYTSTGAATNYGVSAYADFVTNNRQLAISLTLGRALINAPPAASVTYTHGSAPAWNSGVNGFFTATSTVLLYVGAPVYLTGTVPASGNFTANIVYYAIPAIDGSNTTQFQLATTYANAIAGTAIAAGGASNDGSNLVINFAVAGYFGQSRHVQLERELAAHSHTSSNAFINTGISGGGAIHVFEPNDSGQGTSPLPIASDGSSDPFNIVMPVSYANVFLKL